MATLQLPTKAIRIKVKGSKPTKWHLIKHERKSYGGVVFYTSGCDFATYELAEDQLVTEIAEVKDIEPEDICAKCWKFEKGMA